MKYIYDFVWAVITALLTVLTLDWLNGKICFTNWLFISSVVDFIHSHGWSAKDVLFFVLCFLYWINNWKQVITKIIIFFVRSCLRVILTILAIVGAVIAIYIGWQFILWMSSFL